MTDQPVTPDREALEAVVSKALMWRSDANTVVTALLPLLTDALDRARQQGRDEAAEAIRTAGMFDTGIGEDVPDSDDYEAGRFSAFKVAWQLARGGPNRKDEE